MSLQDDIFDVYNFLKTKPIVAVFNRIEEHVNDLEMEVEKLRDENHTLRKAIKIVGEKKKEDKEDLFPDDMGQSDLR
jgi:prefoldin subunit 5